VRGGENQKQGSGAVFGSVFFKEKGRAAAWEHKIKTTGGIPGFDLLPLKIKVAALVLAEKPEEREGGGAPLKKMGLGLGFFLYFFLCCQNCPPL
jgi:hypothetical protein